MISFSLISTARRLVASPARGFSTSSIFQFPKLKTHSGTKKRWRSMPSGIFKRAHAGHSHLNVSKRPGRKNQLAQAAYSSTSQTSKLKKLMPYA
ncbi:hypothetical protein HETIRDRAFT_173387 [Heterobasidion irregulare TC 32-1]|uniref:50S ribosomal protein L35 n=1 Tax=Heterobasidion irregulare (strain TC 32-1) TaxID=747525 RepID=W4K7D3_HETIT|nr:uncharacterized protein HETIRDRAFT_173387 [Heterobasidion irregulare TC 32-1]ETW81708.1 hypothetical protein HETIRDRAFT_173387 [Heterobasidion irregulare TC 32-1]